MEEKEIGVIAHYFSNIGVAIIKLENESLNKGDLIHIKGNTTDFQEEVNSIQVDHKEIDVAPKKSHAGIKVKDSAREGDKVYKIIEQ